MWTLRRKEDKINYLRAQLFCWLVEVLDKQAGAARDCVEKMLGLPKDVPLDSDSVWVDHQSQWVFPRDRNRRGVVSRRFVDTLREFVARDDVRILGGNDNDDRRDCFLKSIEAYGGTEVAMTDALSRAEPRHLIWKALTDGIALFNMKTGERLILNIPPLERGNNLLLADVKITDRCYRGCSYCYQSSTPEGRHAELESLRDILEVLEELNCFEVAVGGGEPTLHPDFPTFLYECRQRWIVPSFSTRRTDWLRDDRIAEAVENNVGGVAFSVDSVSEAAQILREWRAIGLKNKLVFHVILGLWQPEDIAGLIELYQEDHCRFDIVLLGYKAVGRGVANAPILDKEYYEKVKEAVGWWTVSIDTAAARELAKYNLLPFPYAEVLVETEEGRYSVYIDAVNKQTARCSYSDEGAVGYDKKEELRQGILLQLGKN